MSRIRQAPRLYLRKERKGHGTRYVIRDGAAEIATGCGETERAKAELKLMHYIGCEALRRTAPPSLGSIYFLVSSGLVKIGFAKDVSKRLQTIQTFSPVPVTLLGTVPGNLDRERYLHKTLGDHRSHGEWFYLVPEVKRYIEQLLADDANRSPPMGPPTEPVNAKRTTHDSIA